uniref:Autophagy-related protein 2 n=1 Tax=Strigamia maritima TaxID=126957 RepID=T1JN27_STRMM
MPWLAGELPFKSTICKYLLQRYLGDFLQEKGSYEQLSVGLFDGTASLTDVHLDVDTLNEIGETYRLPVEFVDGYIANISVSVPWLSILKESSYVEVQGLSVTVQPKQRLNDGSMFDWSSMATSIQLAQECLKQDLGSDSETVNQSFEGLEIFAQAIESILCRIKVRFLDTVVRVEHVPKDSQHGVAVEFRFKKIDYFDEAGTEEFVNKNCQKNIYENPAFHNKKFYVEGFSFYTDEFPTHARTYARSVSSNDSVDSRKSIDLFATAPVSPDLPPQHSEFENSTDMDDFSNPTSNVAAVGPNPVLAGKFLGRQEICLKLKQVDSVPGPKVATELSLNLCTLFLTPRQVHILLNLASGLLSPGRQSHYSKFTDKHSMSWLGMEDNSNVAPTKQSRNKPMEPVDFIRVEEELQKQMKPIAVGKSLDHRQGWSTHCLEDSDDEFLPMTTHRMSSSVTSDATSVSETTTNDDLNNSHSFNLGGSELTQYKIQISNLNVFILHEDVMTSTTENSDCVAQSSVDQMKNTAETFFADFTELTHRGTSNFEAGRNEFANICKFNHLRLSAYPVKIEGNECTVSSICTSLVTLSCGTMEVVECLMIDKPLKTGENRTEGLWEYCDLLVFDSKSERSQMDSCFRMKVSHAESVGRIRRHRLNLPKTEIQINLEQCRVELDISIVDRISDLLNPQPMYNQCQQRPILCPQTAQACFNQAVDEGDVNSDYVLSAKISAPLLSIFVRFPVPDLRALHDMDRLPWWKRNIRPDIFQIDLTSTIWSTAFNSKQSNSVIEVRWKDADGYYMASAELPKIHFFQATADVQGGSNETEFSCSRLLIKINPVKPPLVVEEDLDDNLDSMPLSSMDTIVQISNNRHPEPSPFSQRNAFYEKQPGDKPECKDSLPDNDQRVMPGDKAEMALFMETTSSNCRFCLDLNLPNWSACLLDKDFYEVVYNRIVNDLFLWEPAAPKPRMTCNKSGNYLPNFNIHGMSSNVFHSFSPKLDLNAELDSNSNSDDDDDERIYYSVYDARKQRKHENPKQIGQNKVAVTIRTNQGRLTLFTPTKEDKDKEITGYCGEIHLQIEDGLCYILSGFQGQRDCSFICLQLNKGAIFHNGLQKCTIEYPQLQNIAMSDVAHLFPTVYHSQPGLFTKLSGCVGTGRDSLDMVSMAIKVNLDQSTNIKTFKVALGISDATLRYKMTPTIQCCVSQFADFFNVRDEYVAGYKEPDIVTELHLNLWSCSVDYRPVNLPLRVALTMESLCISSNIAAHASISRLRFIGEELCLFLSQNCNATQVDLKKDYVEVIDVNFCDLSKQDVTFQQEKVIPTFDKEANEWESGIPLTDIKIALSGINIRTCSDTFCALQDLIAYFTNYGDIINEECKKSAIDELLLMNEDLKTQEEQVHDLMAEAMKESNSNVQSSDGAFVASPSRQEAAGATGEVFLFPDEAVQSSGNDPCPLTLPDDDANSDSDDFLILENDPGVGIMPVSGEPEVRILTTEPISLIENYFTIPMTKTDQLKAPKDFPLPEERYTLRDMSITWHMYGGTDFRPVNQKKKQKTQNGDNRAFQDFSTLKVSFSPASEAVDLTCNNESSANRNRNNNNRPTRNWKHEGGPGRDHDKHIELQLNKVRFQYEKYPISALKGVWQILLIQDVEVRDRLASSQFNKFLYQYSSETVPRQTHANMIVIKSVHTRSKPYVPQLECDVKMSMLPIRLNIDQDALLFLFDFCSEIVSRNSYIAERDEKQQQPVMGVHSTSSSPPTHCDEIWNDSPQQTLNETRESMDTNSSNSPTFFRSFTFSPEVLIRLDYHGKHVDMEQGTLAGLIMGLGQLNNSEIRLKRLSYRHGMLGIEKLVAFAFAEWMQDIKKTQLPGLLGGVGPMHSLLQLIQGIRDLIWLPVEQYKRDGRIVRGIQRGANSFTTSTAMAVLELTNRLVQTIQCAAETAYDMVSSGPSVKKTRAIQNYHPKKPSQPADIREGIASACQIVKDGFSETANVLYAVTSEEHRHKGIPGAVGGVLRQIPPTVVKPFIITAEATSNVLGGMRHQLQPDVRREAAEKWR